MRRTTLVLVLAAGCASRGHPPAEARREPPGPAASQPPPPTPAPVNPPAPDPLAGKTADERWAWARSLVPELARLTPRADTADFSKLNLQNGRLTLYAPKLTLGMAEKPPPPCLPLPVVLERGSLVTRVSLDGRKARPDLADDYTIVRLGVDFNDHAGRAAGDDTGYLSPGSDPLLSEVGRGVIRYDGAPVTYVVLCATHEETRTCSDATTRICRTCTPFITQVPNPGQAADSVSQRQTCDPCPPDPVGQDLAALDQVVRDRRFLEVFPGRGPSFYTSQAACKQALAAKPSPGG